MFSHMTLAVNQVAWGNASLIEIIWTVVGVIGLIVTGFTLREGLKDLKVVNRIERRNIYKTQAIFNLWQEEIRMIKMLIVAATGAFAMTQPPAHSTPTKIALSTLLTVIGLILIVILTVIQSLLDLRIRNLVRKNYNSQQ